MKNPSIYSDNNNQPLVIFILVEIEYAKNDLKCPKIAILGLFQLIASSKQPIKGFFDTQDPPKMYQVVHLNGAVIIWGLRGYI